MQPSTSYFVKDAKLLPDGVFRIDTSGIDSRHALWDGYYDVTPDNPEYDFWLWLQRRLRRRWFGPAGVDEQAIVKYKEEFQRECA
jgi:hypothetical protein